MILQALYKYARDRQAAGTDIAPPGFEYKEIPHYIILDREGRFLDFYFNEDRKELVPKDNARSSDTKPQLLWDYLDYVLGVSPSLKSENPKREKERFQSFIQRICELPDLEAVRPIKLFYEKEYYKDALRETEKIAFIQKKGGRISFALADKPGLLVTKYPEVIAYVQQSLEEESTTKMVCLVTGKSQQPIVMTHPKVTIGPNNSPLIGFQVSQGFDSYLKKQGENAPISYLAADCIHTALQDLLRKDRPNNYRLGNTTYLFWDEAMNERLVELYQKVTFEGKENTEEGTENESETKKKKTTRSKKGKSIPQKLIKETTKELLAELKTIVGEKGKKLTKADNDFYILGIMPQLGRHAVKLWVKGTAQEIVYNSIQHQEDMNIVDWQGNVRDSDNLPLRSLFHVVSQLKPKGKPLDNYSESILNSIIDSIVRGVPYPQQLQAGCLDRIKREHHVNEIRAAILKAYINRKNRFFSKNNHLPSITLTMALDPQQTDIAYVAGRIFSLLERIQYEAQGELNSNIRDRYFTMTATHPSITMGSLISKSSHHLSKIKRERPRVAVNLEKELNELLGLIPGENPNFPLRFNLDQQSVFAVGYYHQKAYSFSKKKQKENENESNTENE